MIPFSRKFTLIRPSVEGEYIDGIWTPGTTAEREIDGSVQPLSARERMMLPEGIRTKASVKIYTEEPLFTAEPGGMKQSDRLRIDGVIWEVVSGQDYSPLIQTPMMGLKHFKSVAQKLDEPETQPAP